MNTIIEGYDYYGGTGLAASGADAMAISPVSWSIAVSVTESSLPCGTVVGTSIGTTIGQGC